VQFKSGAILARPLKISDPAEHETALFRGAEPCSSGRLGRDTATMLTKFSYITYNTYVLRCLRGESGEYGDILVSKLLYNYVFIISYIF